MADEQVRELGRKSAIPQDLGWASLLRLDGDALEGQYLPSSRNSASAPG